MSTTSPVNNRQSLMRLVSPRSIGTSLRRFWQWATVVHTDDPVRLVLNRGFAGILLFFIFISIWLELALIASGETAAATVNVFSIPVLILMWWFNRRGTVYGASLYVLWVITAIILGSPPASYAGADTPIPLLLILPIIIATLFIRPTAGLWALILMMAAYGVRLAFSDVPSAHAWRFMIIGTLNGVAITAVLMVGAFMFSRALRTSIAANEALRRQQEQFHYAALATQDAIYDWDLTTNGMTYNQAYQQLCGTDEIKGAAREWWKTHLNPNDYERVKTGMEKAFQQCNTFWSAEYQLRRFDEHYAAVVDRAYILYDSMGKPLRMIGALTDITERKRAEADHLELALARERDEWLKEFVSTISHDLKTPLTIINTSLYLLQRTTDLEQQKGKVEQIKEQVKHVDRLIQDMLTVSRLDTVPDLALKNVDINSIIISIQAQFQDFVKEHDLTFKLELSPKLPPVWGSEPDLQRVFTNLVENALRYTPANGTVTIRTFQQANGVEVEIHDTGIGIEEADLPHIFESFYRSDQARTVDDRGTGLGLAIVRKIVQRHRGKIEVKSTLGQGSVFQVVLPTAPNA